MPTLAPPPALGSSSSRTSSMSTRALSSAQTIFFQREEETRRAQEALLRQRTAEASRQAQIPGQLQAARVSPENLAIANIERQRAATDYQYALAGLPEPTESEAQQGTGIGVRQALVTPEERVRRQAQVEEAQGALRLAQASERVGLAGTAEDRARSAVREAAEREAEEREAEREKVVKLRQASRPATQPGRRSREEAALANAPFGWMYDPETGFAVAPEVFRKRQAERGMTLDKVNRESVSNREMLNRVSPEGYVWRRSDNAWVDTKTGNELIGGQWRNKDDGTYMNPSDRIWRDRNGNWYDKQLRQWRQAGTGYVQQGIYWVDPASGQRFWQGKPVKSAQQGLSTLTKVALGETPTAAELAALSPEEAAQVHQLLRSNEAASSATSAQQQSRSQVRQAPGLLGQ